LTEIISQLQPIITAIIGAIIYSLSGYAKNKTTEQATFDARKFFVTVGIGAAIGFTSYLFALEYDAALQTLVNTGAVAILETWLKTLYRKIHEEST